MLLQLPANSTMSNKMYVISTDSSRYEDYSCQWVLLPKISPFGRKPQKPKIFAKIIGCDLMLKGSRVWAATTDSVTDTLYYTYYLYYIYLYYSFTILLQYA